MNHRQAIGERMAQRAALFKVVGRGGGNPRSAENNVGISTGVSPRLAAVGVRDHARLTDRRVPRILGVVLAGEHVRLAELHVGQHLGLPAFIASNFALPKSARV